jgi:hypothetical protein
MILARHKSCSKRNKCKILGFHGGDYEECHLLGRYLVALVTTDVLEKCIASIIRVKIIRELGITLAVTTNRSMLHAAVASYW